MKIYDQVRVRNTITHLEQALKEKNDVHIKHFVDDFFVLFAQNKDKTYDKQDQIVLACIDYFTESYFKPISLDIIADKFFISKQSLIARFKKYTKRTPMEYLNELRLSYGRAFLTNTDMSIGEIANKCGFGNVYYFSNTFRKKVGISPSLYREKHQL